MRIGIGAYSLRMDGSANNECRRNEGMSGLRCNGGSSRLRVEQGCQTKSDIRSGGWHMLFNTRAGGFFALDGVKTKAMQKV